jgi:hypothetical protein
VPHAQIGEAMLELVLTGALNKAALLGANR